MSKTKEEQQTKVMLVISDDREAIEDIKQVFDICMPEFIIEIAKNYEEIIEIILLPNLKFILLDLNGQASDNFEILAAIKKKVDVPLITMSYSHDSSLLIKALALEADNHITKPFHQLELVAHIRACLRRRQHQFGKL